MAQITVKLAQLIQALYNIVDSLFVGKFSDSGLTALSIVYPLQLLMIAIAVGTGVGINTAMAHYLGIGDRKKAEEYGGIGTFNFLMNGKREYEQWQCVCHSGRTSQPGACQYERYG